MLLEVVVDQDRKQIICEKAYYSLDFSFILTRRLIKAKEIVN